MVLGDWNGNGGQAFVIAQDRDGDGRTDRLVAIDPDAGWGESATWAVDPDDDLTVLRAQPRADDGHRLAVADARGRVWTLDRQGRPCGRFFAGGGFVPGVTAGDIDADGRNEILTVTSDGHVQALRFSGGGSFERLWQRPGWGSAGQLPSVESPVLADLDGDGRLEVLIGVYERDEGAGAGPPIIADVDGDGRGEVLVGSADGVLRVVSGVVPAARPPLTAADPARPADVCLTPPPSAAIPTRNPALHASGAPRSACLHIPACVPGARRITCALLPSKEIVPVALATGS